tara:strand:+ start:421 stop:1029 length:609 start_codon:yes stop_codon:yes gene_type:complete
MNITGVIHIGGHYGNECDEYCKCESIKHVLFFEPDPGSFQQLNQKIHNQNNVTAINRALGPFSCKMDLYRESWNNGQSNSLLEPHLHKEQYPHIVFNDKLEVKVHPLDKYEPDKVFNMLNIDVQGFELEVLRGAKKTLTQIDYIITEVNKEELYKGCALVDEVDEYLSKFNFTRIDTKWITDTALGNYRPKNETWGDALYIK